MDIINAYKSKLDEALKLIPSMSKYYQLEAVNIWNTVATNVQQLVNDPYLRPEQRNQGPSSNHDGHNALPLETSKGSPPELLDLDSFMAEANSCCLPATVQDSDTSKADVKAETIAISSVSCDEQHISQSHGPCEQFLFPSPLVVHPEDCDQDPTSVAATSEITKNGVLDDFPSHDMVNLSTAAENSGQKKTDEGTIPTTLGPEDSNPRHFQTADLNQATDILLEEPPFLFDNLASDIVNYETSSIYPPNLQECYFVRDEGPIVGPMCDHSVLGTATDTYAPVTGVITQSQYQSDLIVDQSPVVIDSLATMVTATSNHVELPIENYQAQMHAKPTADGVALGDDTTCDICGKSGFSSKGNLNRHKKTHGAVKAFECGVCHSRFSEKKSLKIHQRKHTGERPYKCTLCCKEFSQSSAFRAHMATHTGERSFKCELCQMSFRQASQLKLHEKRHAGVKNFACTHCNAKFLTKGDLDRHFRQHSGEQPFKCQHCDKGFTRRETLNDHLNIHTGRKYYTCSQCDRAFTSSRALRKHISSHSELEMNDPSPVLPEARQKKTKRVRSKHSS